MIRFLHKVGFHGSSWEPYWFTGNVWVKCRVCGKSRMLPFDAVSEVPKGTMIASLVACAILSSCTPIIENYQVWTSEAMQTELRNGAIVRAEMRARGEVPW